MYIYTSYMKRAEILKLNFPSFWVPFHELSFFSVGKMARYDVQCPGLCWSYMYTSKCSSRTDCSEHCPRKHFRYIDSRCHLDLLSDKFDINGTHVYTFAICLNVKNGYYHLFLGQNLKFYILSMILKSKLIFISITMSCMNEFNASVQDCTWYSKQSTLLFSDNLRNFTVTKLHTNHIYSGR